MLSLGLSKGDRVALIAETSVGFVESFFACQYAGLVAVPLAIPMGIGQRASYITKLQGLINSCAPAAIISSEEWVPLITSATEDAPPTHILSNDDFHALPEADVELQKPAPDDIAYLQYTSGSTRFPRGVIITQRSVMANLQVISHDGIKLRAGDRCVSWLPFYHDMGLVGFLLTPVATQLSVDYLRTQDFAMRPLQWLKLIDKNRGSVTVAPPFGYDLSLRRSSEKKLPGWICPVCGLLASVLNRFLLNCLTSSVSILLPLVLTAMPLCLATVWQKIPWRSASLMRTKVLRLMKLTVTFWNMKVVRLHRPANPVRYLHL